MGIVDIILISIGVFIASVACLLFVLWAIFSPAIKARIERERQDVEKLDALIEDANRRLEKMRIERQNNP